MMHVAQPLPPIADDDPWGGCFPPDPAFRDDPYPFLAHLREQPGRRDAARDLAAHALRRRRPAAARRSERHADDRRRAARRRRARVNGPAALHAAAGPPDHTRLRKLVSHGFTPRSWRVAGRHRARGRRLPRRASRPGAHGPDRRPRAPGPVDLICQMMGVPIEDRGASRSGRRRPPSDWPEHVAPPEVRQAATAAGMSLAAYFQELIEARRANLTDDLLSALIRAEEAGDRLSPTSCSRSPSGC